MQSRHVLVTGGAGYLGAHVVLALKASGYAVTAIDDLSTGAPTHGNLADRFVRLDVRDRSAVCALLAKRPAHAVVHTAGRFEPLRSVDAPEVAFDVNVGGTAALVAAMRTVGVTRIAMASDIVVYGKPNAVPVTEDVIARPTTPLGRSLRCCETLLDDCGSAWGLRSIALRFGELAGADAALRAGDERPGRERIISQLARVAHKGRPGARFRIPGGLDEDRTHHPQSVDLIHVSDAAEAVVAALERLDDSDALRVANVSSGEGLSLDVILRTMASLAGNTIDPVRTELRGELPVELVADSRRFRDWTGWSPKRSDLKTILSSALAYEADRP